MTAPTTTAPPAATGGVAGPPSRLWVTPVIVLVGLGLVFGYLATQTLDSVERRTINVETITTRLGEHLYLTALSTVVVIVLAIPLGIALSRPALRRVQPAVLAISGFLQALPPFGVIILIAFTPLGLGATTAIVALVLASFLPVVTNTVVGLRQVDRAMIEAARGVGMSAAQTLRQVELPLAVPVMVAGVRVALVLNVGTATLATYIGAGGLGTIIDGSLRLGRPTAVLVAASLVAALALIIDWLAGVAEHLVGRRGG
ncbi:ABC transporter permease [Pseudonocardia humida]|uniref:ABC transporter permease n=1 Tax=Pseudonocardia humida TaxID=2800819 RepID=A0ABT0ZS77_9PSEU|nr:ABC transporter permease [Pseudonocardia humida]MCO1653575.1 ABC transporter permease [Pseudonocardia humida]